GQQARRVNLKQVTLEPGWGAVTLGCGDGFLDTASRSWSIIEVMDKLDCITTNNFCSEKDHVKKVRRQSWMRRKYWQKTHLTKNLKLNGRKTNNSTKKRAEDPNTHLTRADKQMASRHMKGHSTSSVLRE
ncbi:LORF2 protein, partial [Crocuta crocuta]